jgi:hypothetical protein|tara:strand:+ start:2731 stop:2898 length:168 start_codon:yes stop_codon:yes gene_type:complete
MGLSVKIGDAVKFSNTSVFFAVIIEENEGDVALLFQDGDVKWFKKDKVEAVNENR